MVNADSAGTSIPPTQVSTLPTMLLAMVGLGLICGTLIAFVFETTLPYIAHNKQVALEKSIAAVLPGVTTTSYWYHETHGFKAGIAKTNGTKDRLEKDNLEKESDAKKSDTENQAIHANAVMITAGYDKQGLSAIAISSQGMGYQDRIKLIYAYDPRAQLITAMRVLESRETPGLGSRIHDDPIFLDNFSALPVELDARNQLRHPLQAVKRGKKHPWQIDSITGATVSSKAVVRILNRSLQNWLPKINQQQKDFHHGTSTD